MARFTNYTERAEKAMLETLEDLPIWWRSGTNDDMKFTKADKKDYRMIVGRIMETVSRNTVRCTIVGANDHVKYRIIALAVKEFVQNQKDVPPEFKNIVNSNFWDLI